MSARARAYVHARPPSHPRKLEGQASQHHQQSRCLQNSQLTGGLDQTRDHDFPFRGTALARPPSLQNRPRAHRDEGSPGSPGLGGGFRHTLGKTGNARANGPPLTGHASTRVLS